ncbi:hypothetical protein M2165_004102 [Variovorax sp. TBS-050B]|uniref:TagK domain-containing protein n=1 Tax=Variovorax sp. TBS-050B TaxID=2940551 RepID=UPI002473788D|nr:TagK domain-containing protein [Variovorax sp. TBS-050B]MDH6594213.1 hypothetical protein [Variovorax sp. TBS-050B]
MNKPELDDPVAALRLRLVRSRGRARDRALVFPAAGAGMADALALGGDGGEAPDAQWRAANLCRITWQAQRWQFFNASSAVVCSLNGERVWPHQWADLRPGDALEVGLLRFVVQGAAGDAAPLADVDFELRDLATLLPDAAQRPSAHGSKLDDLFGVLGIEGAGPQPAEDLLAELLGEPPTHAGRSPEPLTPLLADGEGGGIDIDAPANAGPQHTRAGPSALFDALNDEFERVVRDPAQLTGRADWDSAPAPGGERVPTLEELSRAAGEYHLLRDILQAREGIDQLIAEIDPLGPAVLLEESSAEDVLRLFAARLARERRTAVPSLTRREHHDLSPDSHVQIGNFRADKDSSS